MKFGRQVLRGLPVVALVCGMLPAPVEAQFSQQGPKLVATDAIGNAKQGYRVSLSGDGNTAIIGGPFDNGFMGAAWVFTRTGGVWTQQTKLVATDAPEGAEQGIRVSLSGDGNTAIVSGAGANAAWVYRRSGGVWSQQAKLVVPTSNAFGVSLSDDGNIALVGGPNSNEGGAAWVFISSGGVWNQQAKLIGTDAIGGAEQGFSVSLTSDGNTAIVGGPDDNLPVTGSAPGAAWVFTRSGGVWSQQAKLVATDTVSFGYSVSLSDDGNIALVGGPNSNEGGAAWVFTRSGGMWSQQTKLVGTGVVVGAAGGGAGQGASVSLSGDGNTALIGGPGDNPSAHGDALGAAWVFTRSGGMWSQQTKLVGTGAVGGVAAQGASVSLSRDAKTAIVGGPDDNGNPDSAIGAAWVFAQHVFAGTPGKANCHGKSVSALAKQFGGLNNAAAALGFDKRERAARCHYGVLWWVTRLPADRTVFAARWLALPPHEDKG
jgi:hypothetical protein